MSTEDITYTLTASFRFDGRPEIWRLEVERDFPAGTDDRTILAALEDEAMAAGERVCRDSVEMFTSSWPEVVEDRA